MFFVGIFVPYGPKFLEDYMSVRNPNEICTITTFGPYITKTVINFLNDLRMYG